MDLPVRNASERRSSIMQVHRFSFSQTVPLSRSVVWSFFANADNLSSLTPPEAGFEAGEVDGPV
jgi:hypothetical protein